MHLFPAPLGNRGKNREKLVFCEAITCTGCIQGFMNFMHCHIMPACGEKKNMGPLPDSVSSEKLGFDECSSPTWK